MPKYKALRAINEQLGGRATAVGGRVGGGGGGGNDHGSLAGLTDDDHHQYLTRARHAAIDAAEHSSGTATEGQVLAADGAGGAEWVDGGGGGGGDVATDDIWDAKGDLAVGTGADAAARLAVGANGQVLTADSSTATGVKWAAGGGGGGGGRELLATATPSGTNTVTFDDIPADYRKLAVEVVARSDNASAAYAYVMLRCNNDTTDTNYRFTRVGAGGTSFFSNGDKPYIGLVSAGQSTAGSAGTVLAELANYAGTAFRKQCLARTAYRETTHNYVIQFGMEWENTEAIERLDVLLETGDYVAGSVIRLYGEP